MEASEKKGGVSASGEVKGTLQPSRKRPLEDTEEGAAEPEGPQVHRAASPEPDPKRAKTGQRDLSEEEGQESAEEGELKEDGEVLQSSESESGEMGDAESDGSRRLSRSMAFASGGDFDADSKRTTHAMPAAVVNVPAQFGWNQGITSQIRTSLGGSIPPPVPAKPVEPSENNNTKSLNRKERKQEKKAQAVAENKKALEDLKKPFVYAPGLSFWLPTKKNILLPKGKNLGSGVWKTKFKSWCQSFISRNTEQSAQLNADIVVAALQEYIATRAHWTKKRQAGVAAAEARKPEARNDMAVNLATILKNDNFLLGTQQAPVVIDDDDDDDDEEEEEEESKDSDQEVATMSFDATSADAQAAAPRILSQYEQLELEAKQTLSAENIEQPQDKAMTDAMEIQNARLGPPVLSEEEDLAQQRKYFPGLPVPDQICVFCASIGHTSSSCPNVACRFCEYPHHFSWNCPTRERCSKCRQLGHGKGQCTEKLVHLDEEGLECAVCGSQDHLETDCEALWRSYKPRNGMIKKVKNLPAFCASCGSEGHYSSDCALRGDKPRSQTWSLKNRDLYVDKNATDSPISDFTSVPQKPQFNLQIIGSAAKRNHIFYPDSDGSEEGEFIGQKVKPRAPGGNIQMSTNIQFGNIGGSSQPPKNGRGQQFGGWSAAQPPLPPGPPPPGPPAGSYSRMSKSYSNNQQARPPASANGFGRGGLPPKPPAPQSHQHGYHSVGPPPPNGPGPKPPKKPKTRNQPGNLPAIPTPQQQHGGGAAGRRRGKNKRGGKQG